MNNCGIIFIGLDTHKTFTQLAISKNERGAKHELLGTLNTNKSPFKKLARQLLSKSPKNNTALAYYEQQKSKGKPHNTIIRALAFKWIRILFRCWKKSTAYDESTNLATLKSKGSPLLKYAVESKF